MMANANAEILDCNGNTAVHLACYDGKLDCLKILASYVLLPKIYETINYDGMYLIYIKYMNNYFEFDKCNRMIIYILKTKLYFNISYFYFDL